MTVILAFLVGAIAIAFWWLLRQGIMTKPWLETGTTTSIETPQGGAIERLGLGIFLAVVGALFALFGSAFVMRMDLESFASLTLPPILWGNTGQLVIASFFLHMAVASAGRGDAGAFRRDGSIAALATVGFLVGQLLAWRELALAGDGLSTGPAASFFYLLSGLHGLHIVGGLAALGLVVFRGGDLQRLQKSARLCASYWDFLLVVWLGLLMLFLGWANRFVDICRGILT